MNTPRIVDTSPDPNDQYANSADTGVIQGADLEDSEGVGSEVETNAGGLVRTDPGGVDTLSDNLTGNNSMGTGTIAGGFGVGSTNSNATLP